MARNNRENERYNDGFFHKIGRFIKGVLIAVGVVAIGLFVLNKFQDKKTKHAGTREEIIQKEEKFHDIVLNNDTIVAELDAVAEIMTYSQVYAGTATVVDSLQVPYTDIDIWGTQHRIDIMYSGTIKVGYNLDDIQTVVNNQKKEIYITLPTERIVENNLPQENVTCSQDNNIFNSIRADEVTVRLAEVKEEQLQNAINSGIYDKADAHLKEIILQQLAKLHKDYKVVFVDPSVLREQKA